MGKEAIPDPFAVGGELGLLPAARRRYCPDEKPRFVEDARFRRFGSPRGGPRRRGVLCSERLAPEDVTGLTLDDRLRCRGEGEGRSTLM